MTKIASVAEVQETGVTIQAEEAVAIAQQLIETLQRCADDPVGRPYGPPTAATVHLVDAGSVVCRGCETTPAVSEIAILLQQMLPQTTRVPGGLRYSIARALLDVDVPPFDSLDDFSETLARYERGPREQIIRRVLERFDARRTLVPRSAADRRRHPHATELRRALRDADAQLYLQKVATETAMTVTSRRPRPRNARAAACVAAGLLMIAAGVFIDGGPSSGAPVVVAAPPAPAPSFPVGDVPVSVQRNMNAAGPEPLDPRARPATDTRAANRDLRSPEKRPRTTTRRPASVMRAHHSRETARKTAAARSILERLRLNWLRNVITSL